MSFYSFKGPFPRSAAHTDEEASLMDTAVAAGHGDVQADAEASGDVDLGATRDTSVELDASSLASELATHPLAAEEWLASLILEHVADVRQIWRLALVNRNFWAASLCHFLWQKLLPPQPLLDAVLESSPLHGTSLCKRDLYMRLCKSIPYDNGLKKFWLDPASGADCYMISAIALSIVWADTAESKPWPGAMFSEVAYLHSVCWFDVRGKFQQHLRPGKYTVSFRMQLNIPEKSSDGSPVKISLHNVSYLQPPCTSQVALEDTASFRRRSCPLPDSPSAFRTPSSSSETLIHSCAESDVQHTANTHVYIHEGNIEGRHRNVSTLFNRFGALFLHPLGRVGCVRRLKPECFIDIREHATVLEERRHETSFLSHADSLPEWIECDAGEFLVEDDNGGRPIEVHFSMEEIEVFWCKGGLVLDGVIIRPSFVAESITIK